MNPVSGKDFAYHGLKTSIHVFYTPQEIKEIETNREISQMNFNKYFDGIFQPKL